MTCTWELLHFSHALKQERKYYFLLSDWAWSELICLGVGEGGKEGDSGTQMQEEVGVSMDVFNLLAELLQTVLFSHRVLRASSRLLSCASPKQRKWGMQPGKQHCPLVSLSYCFLVTWNSAEPEQAWTHLGQWNFYQQLLHKHWDKLRTTCNNHRLC